MVNIPPKIGNSLAMLTIMCAAGGGVFFGLFSCGGKAWQHQAFLWIMLCGVLLSILVSGDLLRSWGRRGTFLVFVILVFVFFQALTAPFYPSAPSSPTEYGRRVFRVLESGPC